MTEPLPPLPYDWSEIRKRLQDRIWDLLDRLNLRNELAGARGDGARIFPRSPLRTDRKAGSFVIWVDGYRVGAWKDYAVPAHHGDVFDLVMRVEKLRSKIDVYWWALDFLGLERRGATDNPRRKSDIEAERERRDAERQAAEAKMLADGEAKSADLFKFWLSCAPLMGSPAERYLREARRIPLERLAHAPGALRWSPLFEHVDAHGEVHEWRNAMVSAMTRGKKLAALHFTFLKPDGSGKADREKAKLMLGPVKGSAIRLSSGPTGLSPTKAAAAGKTGPLAIGEGIETCLTVAAARPDYRVWAAGSLSLMGLLDWPPCASAVVLLGENDWKPAAREAFQKIHGHWRSQAKGRPLEVVNSAVGSDFNDWARKAI
ncbi:DUF7146 domain-containing protein [Phenylobacterium sp.]|uniref:DUF7146 domain-containing protein n=1 Tax=Phenylobacterium sp. TaxID=1871053 RepID=UPI002DED36FD|nr:toprim domain-containing protein [Phenylobacterium sp.]